MHTRRIHRRVPDLLGSNLTYLLLLIQVAAHKDLPTMWKELVRGPKYQHLTSPHRALDDITQRLSLWEPIVVTSGLFNLTLALVLRLEHCSDLGLVLH